MNPAADHYAWPVPTAADAARALADMDGDLRRGLPPKVDDALIVLAAARATDTGARLGQPVPYTLTPKALGLLDKVPDGQWACTGCGDAWFGETPDDGLCPACRAGEPEP